MGGRHDRGQLVQQRERIVTGAGHADGLRSDQRAAAGPGADQGERVPIAAHEERRPLGRQVPAKLAAPRFHAGMIAH